MFNTKMCCRRRRSTTLAEKSFRKEKALTDGAAKKLIENYESIVDVDVGFDVDVDGVVARIKSEN